MNSTTTRVLIALAIYVAATLISVMMLHARSLGLFVDGALLLCFMYYLTTLARARSQP